MTAGMQSINGISRILAIIGHPVGHSLSPLMQNSALQACSLNFVYVPFEITPESLGDAVNAIKTLGIKGVNVTIPYKSAIMKYLDGLDESAIEAGAVNTVNNESGKLIGYNTDGAGLVRSLATELDFKPQDRTILLMGAGGAARGALAALCRAGARRVVVFNRTYSAAVQLVAFMKDRYPDADLIALKHSSELDAALTNVDLIVNATSLGMKHEQINGLHLNLLPRTAKVYDMVYAPPVTQLMMDASKAGLQSVNGLGMLAAQGELAFYIWTGITPPSGLMKRVLSSICNN